MEPVHAVPNEPDLPPELGEAVGQERQLPEVEPRPQELLQARVVVYSVEEEVQSPYLEDDEAPPDQGVEQAGVPVVWPRHPGVAPEPGDKTDSALDRVGETVDPLRP